MLKYLTKLTLNKGGLFEFIVDQIVHYGQGRQSGWNLTKLHLQQEAESNAPEWSTHFPFSIQLRTPAHSMATPRVRVGHPLSLIQPQYFL